MPVTHSHEMLNEFLNEHVVNNHTLVCQKFSNFKELGNTCECDAPVGYRCILEPKKVKDLCLEPLSLEKAKNPLKERNNELIVATLAWKINQASPTGPNILVPCSLQSVNPNLIRH